ncbi:MAG: sulfite exporter TauE/SafE family protein [Cyclobacteriaceae bacterium]
MIGAFLIGVFGSVHCVGMCGPLMVSLSGKSASSFFIYHFGRILVYALIGVFFGLISSSVRFFEVQQYFSIFLGAIIIVLFGLPKIRNRFEGWYYNSPIYQNAKNKLTGYYGTRFRWLSAGVLNGFLPCGLIYLAAAGALLTHDIGSAISYMIIFGLGTLPALMALGLIRNYAPSLMRRLTNLTTPIALLSGFVLIIRGVLVQSPDLNSLLQAQIANVVSACGF